MYPKDPVNIDPIPPLQDSYSYHSEPYGEDAREEWIMGIDEAGRGRKSWIWIPPGFTERSYCLSHNADNVLAVLGISNSIEEGKRMITQMQMLMLMSI